MMFLGANKILRTGVKQNIPMGLIPMAFKLADGAFNDEAWQFEVKWDGFRILSYCDNLKVSLRSRNNKCFNKRLSQIKSELQHLKLNALLDGEVVVLDDNGCSNFSRLMDGETAGLVYYVFDLLWYKGYDLKGLPLYQRRQVLRDILPVSDTIRFSEHVDERGKDLFELIKGKGIEGIVAKNKFSHYIPGIRTSQWLKIKAAQESRAIIAGVLRDQEKSGSGFNSLIIANKNDGAYNYIGLVEAGIKRHDLEKILNAKPAKKSIFDPVPNVNRRAAFRDKIKKPSVTWLKPELHCKVKYLELDKYGIMRHASFKGLL